MTQELAQFDSLKADITIFVAPVQTLTVTDFKSSADAIEAGKQIKALQKQVEDKRKALVDPINRQLKLINGYAKDITQPLEAAEAHIRAQLNRFAEEQEKIKREEFRRAEEERLAKERRADEERQRMHAESEAKKQAELAELERAQAAAQELFGVDDGASEAVEQQRADIEERAERERIENEARLEREQAIRNSQSRQTEYDIAQNQIKNARKNWKVTVVDINLVPKEFLSIEVNEKLALAAARAGQTNIPGLKFTQEISVSLGSKTYVPQKLLHS